MSSVVLVPCVVLNLIQEGICCLKKLLVSVRMLVTRGVQKVPSSADGKTTALDERLKSVNVEICAIEIRWLIDVNGRR